MKNKSIRKSLYSNKNILELIISYINNFNKLYTIYIDFCLNFNISELILDSITCAYI